MTCGNLLGLQRAISRESAYVATIGENIRAARIRAGYATGKAFAAAIAAPESRISEWEKDTYKPRLATLLRVATFLRLSIDDLLDGVDSDYDRARNDLTWQTGDLQSPLPQQLGGSLDAATATRMEQQHIDDFSKKAREVLQLSDKLNDLATDLEEIRKAAEATASRRSHHRKTG